MPIELFFFIFLFPSYCHSVVHRVVSILPDGCNQSSIVFFYVVFESLYRCVDAIFNAGKSSSPLWDVMPYAWSLVFLFFDQFVQVPLLSTSKRSRISNERYSPGIYSFDKVSGR